MGFGKAFLLSLVVFVGLNFVVSIIYLLLGPGIDVLLNRFNNDPNNLEYGPLMIIYYLFGSASSLPSTNLDWAIVQPLFSTPSNMDYLVLGIGFLVTPIIASILAGKFAESKGQAVGVWLLIVAISTGAIVVGVIPGLSDTFVSNLGTFYGWSGFESTLIFIAISGVINIVYGGFFALLVVETEYY